jgi:hypothetical protein
MSKMDDETIKFVEFLKKCGLEDLTENEVGDAVEQREELKTFINLYPILAHQIVFAIERSYTNEARSCNNEANLEVLRKNLNESLGTEKVTIATNNETKALSQESDQKKTIH